MKKSDFYASMHTLIPGCTPEITRKWIDFAEENVDHGHFVDFKLSEDKTSGMERWLDTIYAGLCGIREQYDPKIAGKMAGLDSDGLPCFYPGEMKLAAESLLHGDTPDIIAEKMESGIIESQPPFFPMPDHQLTERDCGPEIDIIHKSVCLGLHDERVIPGFVLQDGILLLESDRDKSGCYRGGVKIGGECVHTYELYRPVYSENGHLRAFRQVCSVEELNGNLEYTELKKIFEGQKRSALTRGLTAHVVFTEDSWPRRYPLLSRTYWFTSNSKMFQPRMISKSLYGYCLDGTDQGVRLDCYMAEEGNANGWKVQTCYILEHMRDVAAIPNLTRTPQEDGTIGYFFGDTCIRAFESNEDGKITLKPVSGSQVARGEWAELETDRVYGYCTMLERHLNRNV